MYFESADGKIERQHAVLKVLSTTATDLSQQVEAIPVPILVARGSDRSILYGNLAAADLLGMSHQELLSGTSLDCYCDRAVWQTVLQDLEANQTSQNHEIRCQRADGKPFWANASWQRLEFQHEAAILGIFSDITKYKQAEAALQEKESFLQLVLDNIPQLIFWKDRNSVFLGCNRLWANAVGLSHPNQVIGKTDRDLCNDPTDVERYLSKDRQVMETGEPEFLVEYKPEKDVWFDTKKIPIYNSAGIIVGILATTEDITQRKQAEEALRLAEENYRSIFENALEGIFQATPGGRFIRVNPAMAHIYGYESPQAMVSEIEAIGRQIYVNAACWQQFVSAMEENGTVKDFEYQAYRQDGRIIWVEEDARAVFDSNGKLLYYEGIIQDITKRKQEEAALRQQVEQLKIEIDQQKRTHQVAEITSTDYFQSLKKRARSLRQDTSEG